MLYSEKIKTFAAAHPCEDITVDGAHFRYILCGKEGGRTLVLLNGGMNTLEMWMDYVDALSEENRVLLFDYPQQLPTNQALVTGMHAFFKAIGVESPIFIGASDGGMVSQIYVQKYPGETGGLILISTGGMDAETLSRIFEQFYQGETDRRADGCGLGLTLCKRIVEQHGGTISAESRPGEGSRFSVALPAKTAKSM